MSARGKHTKGKGKKQFIKKVTDDAREDEMNDNLACVRSGGGGVGFFLVVFLFIYF
jgi:hypothetical protein